MIYISLLFAVIIAVADQIIKVWALDNLSVGQTRDFIILDGEKVLGLTLHFNDGAVFGSFSGMRVLLIILPIVMIAFCLWVMFKRKITKPFPILLFGAIIGGGLGNLIDRIFRGGEVVDYLDVQMFDFAIFNFADCFITVGCILMAVYLIFFDKELFPDETAQTIAGADLIDVSSVAYEDIDKDAGQ
ncbi:MAG: signal peptidase II [Oscillospiraceae bacterium]|nr:signal peptidase II [Oscillospiraceae bacterium]